MGAGYKRCQAPRDVFRMIQRAKRLGLPVVPLVGAGLSLEAEVPTTGLMIDSMAKVKLLLDLPVRKDGDDDYAGLLKS